MRAREPNSSHWTSSQEEALLPPIKRFKFLAHKMSQNEDSGTGSSSSSDGSQVSKYMHVGGGRSSHRNFWCFWHDELLEQSSEHLWQTVPHRSNILAAPASQAYVDRGRPAYCWSQKQNDQVIVNVSLFETEQKVLANTGINDSVWTLEL